MISLVVFEEITGLTLVMHQDAPSKDVKVGVIDNLCISVASLHVLCAHAASSVSQPLFLDLLATGYGKPPSFPCEMVFRRWGVNDKKRPCQTWRLVLWNS